MKIDSEGVKLALYGVAAVAVFALGYSVYKKMAGIGATVSNAANSAVATGERVMIALKETAAEADNFVQNSVDNAKRAVGIQVNQNPDYEAPEYVTELSLSKWPESIKAEIRALKKLRGIKIQNVDADFIGWKVYSNGTFIGPEGDYNLDVSANYPETSESGFAFQPIWYNGATNYDPAKILAQWQQQ